MQGRFVACDCCCQGRSREIPEMSPPMPANPFSPVRDICTLEPFKPFKASPRALAHLLNTRCCSSACDSTVEDRHQHGVLSVPPSVAQQISRRRNAGRVPTNAPAGGVALLAVCTRALSHVSTLLL